MTEIMTLLDMTQLKELDKQIKTRNEIANLYLNELKHFYKKLNLINIPKFK